MKDLSIAFSENIENDKTSLVTEDENDVCKFSCDIRRLYKKSKSLLYFMTLITLYEEVRRLLELIPQNLRRREKCLLDSKNRKAGSDFHVIL